MKPKARHDALIREDVDGETILFDPETDKIHCLNPTALWVWEHCDGTRDVDTLGQMVGEASGEEVPEEVVGLALERLARAQLLEGLSEVPALEEPTRRDTLKRLAKAGLALPMIMTMVTPLAGQAATMITPGDCWSDARRNEGRCCTNGRRCRRFGRIGLCWGSRC